jgi:hypothetical protein
MVAKIPTLIYAVGKNGIYINQFVNSTAEIRRDSGNVVCLTQETEYPSEGRIILKVEPQKAESLVLHLRLPAWCQRPSLSANGEAVGGLKPGTYVRLEREWKKGDRVTLSLPMRVQWVKRSHTTEDLWALTRGPVVYAVDTVLWDKQAAEALGEVPKDLSKAIGLVADEGKPRVPLENAALPAGALGPGYEVAVVLPDGARTKVRAWPYTNVGQWYADPGHKPERDERRYAFAAWLHVAAKK